MAGKVIIRDRGYDKIMRNLKNATHEVTIGIHAADGSEQHEQGQTTAAVGAYHELGLGVPKRSFLAPTIDENEKKYQRFFNKAGDQPIKKTLALIGEKAASDVRKKIRSNIAPALSPKTIARKGSTVALIDSGQLINSITYEVK